MTDRRLTPEEIERADAAYRQWWLSFLTLGLIPGPEPRPAAALDARILPDGTFVHVGHHVIREREAEIG